MYNNKKIIGIVGKIGSGKSYLLNILKENTKVNCIDCDEIVRDLMPKEQREAIIKSHGIKYLEQILFKDIRDIVEVGLSYDWHDVIAIEGIKTKELFDDIIDVYIEFDVPYEIRKQRALSRGDSEEKFEYLNKLQEDL